MQTSPAANVYVYARMHTHGQMDTNTNIDVNEPFHTDNVLTHLSAGQDILDDLNGVRDSGTAGHSQLQRNITTP